MGSPLPDGSPPLTLPAQDALLHRKYGVPARYRDADRLVWLGTLTPTDYSHTYDVLIDHQLDKPPLVYIPTPHLQLAPGEDQLPHVYRLNTLCLYRGNAQWYPSVSIADTLVPWASEWLFYYELWAHEGVWHGEGIHPASTTPNRAARRRRDRDDASKRKRLRSALRYGYGGDVNMDDLLFNSTLRGSGRGSKVRRAA